MISDISCSRTDLLRIFSLHSDISRSCCLLFLLLLSALLCFALLCFALLSVVAHVLFQFKSVMVFLRSLILTTVHCGTRSTLLLYAWVILHYLHVTLHRDSLVVLLTLFLSSRWIVLLTLPFFRPRFCPVASVWPIFAIDLTRIDLVGEILSNLSLKPLPRYCRPPDLSSPSSLITVAGAASGALIQRP